MIEWAHSHCFNVTFQGPFVIRFSWCWFQWFANSLISLAHVDITITIQNHVFESQLLSLKVLCELLSLSLSVCFLTHCNHLKCLSSASLKMFDSFRHFPVNWNVFITYQVIDLPLEMKKTWLLSFGHVPRAKSRAVFTKQIEGLHFEPKGRNKMHLHLLVGFWWPRDFNLWLFDYCNYRFTEKNITAV